ncbi:Hypothetical protein D9617_3g019560 [Elsinoe fawcettii]|nr:Hypothetical protein D9617_3g019560 [Elsinoe fawcettii]
MGCLDISYYHLVNHIVPGPQSLSYFVPFVLLPLGLLLHPEILSRKAQCYVFIPIIAASVVHAWYAMGAVDVISVDGLLWSTYLLGIKDPRKDFILLVKRTAPAHPTNDKEPNGTLNNTTSSNGIEYDHIPYPCDLPSRLSWVGSLLISLRLTNWLISDPYHDRHQPVPPTSRRHGEYIISTLIQSFIGYLLLDISSLLISHDPFFTNTSIPILSPLTLTNSLPPLLQTLYASSIGASALRAALTATQAWALVAGQYHLPTVLPVALHWSGAWPDEWAPHLWPPYFGSVSVILSHGLRGFWGAYWHQVMRFVVAGPGGAVVDLVLGRERRDEVPEGEKMGTEEKSGGAKEAMEVTKVVTPAEGGTKKARRKRARYTLVTIVAFFLSGCIHMGLVPRAPRGEISANSIRLLVGGFFWLQPFGMIVEQVGAGLLSRVVPTSMRKTKAGLALGKGIRGWEADGLVQALYCALEPHTSVAGRRWVDVALLEQLKEGSDIMYWLIDTLARS